MEFTKDHIERTEKMPHIMAGGSSEPFKKRLFHFHPYKKDFEANKLMKK